MQAIAVERDIAAVTSPGAQAEAIRLELADAWGEMGAAWGVAPAIARVHLYLMVRGAPLTEREIREALGLSHRAASVALQAAVAWGVVERVAELRRVGRRGPAGTAYGAVSEPFLWFARVIAQRKRLEGDPVVAVLERTLGDAQAAADANPGDAELRALLDWTKGFLGFVRLFDRAVGLLPAIPAADLERLLAILAALPDDTVLGIARLAAELPERDLRALADGIGGLSPTAARRLLAPVAGLVRAAHRQGGRAGGG